MVIVKRVLVALRLLKLNRSAKVTQGNATVEGMSGNPEFFPPEESAPVISALTTATANLSDADAATASGSHESFAAAEAAETQWDMMMRNAAAYVQQKADAQPAAAVEIILSAALKIKKAPVKATDPTPVEDIQANITGLGNAIRLKIVSSNPYGCRFEVVMTETPEVESSWVPVANITARKLMVKDLVNGTRYYFKTRAINNIGASIYSEVISQIAA